MPDPLLSDEDLTRAFRAARDRLMWSGGSNARDAMLAGLRAVEAAVLERAAPMLADFRRTAVRDTATIQRQAERIARLEAALREIEAAETAWGEGTDSNMERVRTLASAALAGERDDG